MLRAAMLLALVACPRSEPVAVLDDLHVSELMVDPVLSVDGTWLELTNGRAEAVDLAGLELVIDGSDVVLTEPPVLQPDEVWVVGGSASADSLVPDLVLDPAGVSVRVLLDGIELDAVDYDPSTWPAPVGASVTRDPSWGPVNDPGGWCEAWTARPGDDFASPGLPNTPCACAMVYSYELIPAGDPAGTVAGEAELRVELDGSFVADGESGEFQRSTDAEGQHVQWAFSTGVTYRGSRPPGQPGFVDQPVDVPASLGEYTGSWSAGPCE
jgi:hypothetical protein